MRFMMKPTAKVLRDMIMSAFDQQYRLDGAPPRGPLARAVMAGIASKGKGKGRGRGKGGRKGQ